MRSRLESTWCWFVGVLMCWMGSAVPAQPEASPPNILLIVVDDLGWQDLSVPGSGTPQPENQHFRTPHVAGLAARGVRFSQGYASAPVCTPTRVSLMTGQSPSRHGVTYWTLHQDQDTSGQHPRLRPPPWRLNGLQPAVPTLPGELRKLGYRTIHVGKAHWGANGTPGADPTALGYDVNVAGHGAGAPGSYLGQDGFRGKPGANGKPSPWDVPGLERWHGEDVFLTEALATEACERLVEASQLKRSWFLHFAPYAVHTPIMANEKHLSAYAGLTEREAAYATLVASVDAAVGRIWDTVRTLGQADRTFVVFVSDNGGLSAHGRGGAPHRHNAPLRSGKGSAYEGGVRVPWVMAGPHIPGGRVDDTPVVTEDLFPTLLGWAGGAVPEGLVVDGVDLGPRARGEGSLGPRDLVWHMPHVWGPKGPGIAPYSALRRGPWKLIHFHDTDRLELFDLSEDLGEHRDLSQEHPDRVRVLATALTDTLRDRGARLSLIRETGEPVRSAAELARR